MSEVFIINPFWFLTKDEWSWSPFVVEGWNVLKTQNYKIKTKLTLRDNENQYELGI